MSEKRASRGRERKERDETEKERERSEKLEKRLSRGREREAAKEEKERERAEKRLSKGREEREKKEVEREAKLEKRLSRGREKREKEITERETERAIEPTHSAKLEKRQSRGRERDASILSPRTPVTITVQAGANATVSAVDQSTQANLSTSSRVHVPLLPLTTPIIAPSTIVVSPTTNKSSTTTSESARDNSAVPVKSVFASPVLTGLLSSLHSSGTKATSVSGSSGALPSLHQQRGKEKDSIPVQQRSGTDEPAHTILINKDLESFVECSEEGNGALSSRGRDRERMTEHRTRKMSRDEGQEARSGCEPLSAVKEGEDVVEMSELEYTQHVQLMGRPKHSTSTASTSTQRLVQDSIRALNPDSEIDNSISVSSNVNVNRANRSLSEPFPLSSSGDAIGEKRRETTTQYQKGELANVLLGEENEDRFFNTPNNNNSNLSNAILENNNNKNEAVNRANDTATLLLQKERALSNASMTDLADSLRSRSDSTSSYILRCEIPESISSLWSKLLIDDGTKLKGGHIDMSMHDDTHVIGGNLAIPQHQQQQKPELTLLDLKGSELNHAESRAMSVSSPHLLEKESLLPTVNTTAPSSTSAPVLSLTSSPSSGTVSTTLLVPPTEQNSQHNSSHSPSPTHSPGMTTPTPLNSSDYLPPKRKSPNHVRKSMEDLFAHIVDSSNTAQSGSANNKINLSNVSSANTVSHLYLPPNLTSSNPKSAEGKSPNKDACVLTSSNAKLEKLERHKSKKKEKSREREKKEGQ
jgi:hypothetical protein